MGACVSVVSGSGVLLPGSASSSARFDDHGDDDASGHHLHDSSGADPRHPKGPGGREQRHERGERDGFGGALGRHEEEEEVSTDDGGAWPLMTGRLKRSMP